MHSHWTRKFPRVFTLHPGLNYKSTTIRREPCGMCTIWDKLPAEGGTRTYIGGFIHIQQGSRY